MADGTRQDRIKFDQTTIDDTEAQFSGDVETKYVELRDQAAIPAAPTDKESGILATLASTNALNFRSSAGTLVDISTGVTDATAHAASDGTSHANVALNDTHRSSDGTDHANVVLNDTHRASDGLDHSIIARVLSRAVITAAGGAGGATAGTISVQISDLDGTAVSRAVTLRLIASDTDGAGTVDSAANATFGAATTGTLVAGSGGATAVVTTDATGLYEGALANSADETVYFSAASFDGGAPTGGDLTQGCIIAECVADDATWSA